MPAVFNSECPVGPNLLAQERALDGGDEAIYAGICCEMASALWRMAGRLLVLLGSPCAGRHAAILVIVREHFDYVLLGFCVWRNPAVSSDGTFACVVAGDC